MDSSAEKQVPSHPFTAADVEVMRAMHLRLAHRKFGMLIALQATGLLLTMFWAIYIIASCTLPMRIHLRWVNEWVILVSLLLVIINIAGIVVTVKKYRAVLRFLRDPATHPDLIIAGQMALTDASVALAGKPSPAAGCHPIF
ncbi:hypothetical protein H4R21_003557 [Coemansia helicoidea]|uniref:Uncharacterized protein n=1 Tax=Coemansia helicoidea TaxID=1286919 RepID=A0ACC1L2P9_9FUNG|nr:hypothetical protein H4R21_003557 [Coemansia helicoidea]